MKQNFKQITSLVVALFATMCVISSCSEEESMVDATREQKVQELIRVSRSLADKHEIAMCFTEQMIRGGVDTLTVEDLERAYEVYAANTVEFYVCTDSTLANANGLKLSRSSRMTEENGGILDPNVGGTLIGEYDLNWTPTNNNGSRLAMDYSGSLRVRIDWGFYVTQGAVTFFPSFTNPQHPVTYFDVFNYNLFADPNNNPVFESEGFFSICMDGARCDFAVWGYESVFTRLMKLTLYYSTSNSSGVFELSNNGVELRV